MIAGIMAVCNPLAFNGPPINGTSVRNVAVTRVVEYGNANGSAISRWKISRSTLAILSDSKIIGATIIGFCMDDVDIESPEIITTIRLLRWSMTACWLNERDETPALSRILEA